MFLNFWFLSSGTEILCLIKLVRVNIIEDRIIKENRFKLLNVTCIDEKYSENVFILNLFTYKLLDFAKL